MTPDCSVVLTFRDKDPDLSPVSRGRVCNIMTCHQLYLDYTIIMSKNDNDTMHVMYIRPFLKVCFLQEKLLSNLVWSVKVYLFLS